MPTVAAGALVVFLSEAHHGVRWGGDLTSGKNRSKKIWTWPTISGQIWMLSCNCLVRAEASSIVSIRLLRAMFHTLWIPLAIWENPSQGDCGWWFSSYVRLPGGKWPTINVTVGCSWSMIVLSLCQFICSMFIRVFSEDKDKPIATTTLWDVHGQNLAKIAETQPWSDKNLGQLMQDFVSPWQVCRYIDVVWKCSYMFINDLVFISEIGNLQSISWWTLKIWTSRLGSSIGEE